MRTKRVVGKGEPLFEELVRQADAQYRGIREFLEWSPTPFDRELWSDAKRALDLERSSASVESLAESVRFGLRASAVDTGALEDLYAADRGFTFSVAAQSGTWESEIAARGPNVRSLFEAQLAALDLVVDAATGTTEVSEVFVRRLHEELCREQATYRVRTSVGWQDQPLPRGAYKTQPNHVQLVDGSLIAFSPVDRTPAEMHRLVTELRTPAFLAAHPVLQAAYAHHALVGIHPFADGNGRVARALASLFTYRAASIPLLVYAAQKPAYIGALHEADQERFSPFVSLVLDAAVDLMNVLTMRLRAARSPLVHESVRDVDKLFVDAGGLTHSELDATAMRIARALREEIAQQLPTATSPRVECEVHQEASAITSSNPGYRSVVGKRATVIVRLRSGAPAQASAEERFHVLVARDPAARATFRVEPPDGREALDVRLNQIYPEETESFRSLLASWVRIRLSEMGVALHSRATEAMRLRGL